MAKKKKRKKKLYNKKQFKNIFCNKCKLCDGKPTFCYSEIYRKHPTIFTKKIFDRLIEIKDWNKNKKRNILGPEEFRYAFCMSLTTSCEPLSNFDEIQAHTSVCSKLQSCYNKFNEQQSGKGTRRNIIRINKRKKRAKYKGKNRYVCEPYPTIIMSDNPEWKEFIKGLFENIDEDNIDKQNTPDETSC